MMFMFLEYYYVQDYETMTVFMLMTVELRWFQHVIFFPSLEIR